MMKLKSITSALTAASLSLIAASCLAADLQVANAWVREAPPGSEVLAAYMSVHNNGTKTVALTGASSPAVRRIELHRTVMDNGVASMIAQDRVEVPPGKTLSFEPGSFHLMLFNPTEALPAGKKIEISLKLDDGTQIETQAEVRRATAAPMEHHQPGQ
jgi:hypothetical protein